MDMKKNWEKCVLGAIFAVMTILYFIAWIDGGVTFEFLGPIAVATLIFLLGVTAYFVCECYAPEYSKWMLLATGIINTILIVIAFLNVVDFPLTFSFITTMILVPLAVYALLPLILGIRKVLNKATA